MTPGVNALARVLAGGLDPEIAHYREARRIALDLQLLHVTLEYDPPVADITPELAVMDAAIASLRGVSASPINSSQVAATHLDAQHHV